jgi:hypothetical protein
MMSLWKRMTSILNEKLEKIKRENEEVGIEKKKT